MKRIQIFRASALHFPKFALAGVLVLASSSLAAAPIAFSTEPLLSTTGTNVKPNIMYILDDSGTMKYDYLPDWANDKSPFTGTSYTNMPELFTNSGFNGVAYNPAVTYTKPVFYTAAGLLDTTTYPSYSSSTSWTVVKRDGFDVLSTSTDNLVGKASYYTFIEGEYCSSLKKTDCVASTTPTTVGSVSYDVPAGLRWCDGADLANCQSINDSTFKYPRYPGEALASRATIRITSSTTATSITVAGQEILSSNNVTGTSASKLASAIVNAINNCTAGITGQCTIAGYSASVPNKSSTITLVAPLSLGGITDTPVVTGPNATITAFVPGVQVPGSNVQTKVVSTTLAYAYPGTTSKAATRTDCAGTTCTYTEEMTNYANWWAYYHTRTQAMKTAVSRAFQSLNQNYRVGFSTICDTTATTGTNFLANDTFELGQKNSWYKKLFATGTGCYTPLRGALSKTGQYYAHKIGSVDPVQYSCQQNFAILSTDGYWNTNDESSTFGPFGIDGSSVGDQDSDPATRSSGVYQGPTATSETLADVAKYYYDTDLRDKALWGNCAGAKSTEFPAGNPDVCLNNVRNATNNGKGQQQMVTFTMGLGADGELNYQSDYDTASTGDFYDLKNALGTPTVNWPSPKANVASAIDDLWHAAVNGGGQYFSAKDPNQIVNGFNKVLNSIKATKGAASAAATSTLNPVAGNNFAYLASYTTADWTGNLEARTIDPKSGAVSTSASWCVENISTSLCLQANRVETSPGSGFWNCVVPSTAADCTDPASTYSSGNCITPITNTCTGTMTRPPVATPMVAQHTDNRTIYTAPAGGATLVAGKNLTEFNSAYATANPGSFSPSVTAPTTHVNALTQWPTISSAHTADKLINYLRGQTGYEDTASNPVADRLYRPRVTVLGDALESQPAFVANPLFDYVYSGYADFKTAQASRKGTVFVGANDGMLHAFVGQTSGTEVGGHERWAYVPSMVIPNMWKLADSNYSNNHTNFVNGAPVISDICVLSSCSAATGSDWRTILVAGLNSGGRGYYALDITNPDSPALLWEFTTTAGIGAIQRDNLGYSYGRPVIARRKSDGKWVVVVTSGYNNTSPGDGRGYLYVLDAATGTVLSEYPTNVGSTTDPSGLASVALWDEASGGNEAKYAYATDLQGNIWRFDITAASGTAGFRLATLKDAGGNPQPITTIPVLTTFNSIRVIIVATGKFLEAGDLTTTQTQSIYAIKDDLVSTTPLDNPRAHTTTTPKMVQQTITPNGSVRTGSKTPVDFNTDLGWFVDLPDIGTGSERVNVTPQLVNGSLMVASLVPASSSCSPGGYGWFNYFDYASGWPIDGGVGNTNVSIKYDSVIVGFNLIYIDGKPKVITVTANGDISGGCPDCNPPPPPPPGFSQHRSVWRELAPKH